MNSSVAPVPDTEVLTAQLFRYAQDIRHSSSQLRWQYTQQEGTLIGRNVGQLIRVPRATSMEGQLKRVCGSSHPASALQLRLDMVHLKQPRHAVIQMLGCKASQTASRAFCNSATSLPRPKWMS